MPKTHRKAEHVRTQPIPEDIRNSPTIDSLTKEVLRLQLQVSELRDEFQEALLATYCDHSSNAMRAQPMLSMTFEEEATLLDQERAAATDDKDAEREQAYAQGQLFS